MPLETPPSSSTYQPLQPTTNKVATTTKGPTPPTKEPIPTPQPQQTTALPPNPISTPTPTPAQPPRRRPRAAALAAFEKVSSLYAPALLATESVSDSDSSSTTTAAEKPALQHPLPSQGTRDWDDASESDSDDYIDDLEPGLPRTKRTKILKKRKRVIETRRGERFERLDSEDLDLAARAEGTGSGCGRNRRKDGRKKKGGQRKRAKINPRFAEEVRIVKSGVDEDFGATPEAKAATGSAEQGQRADDEVSVTTGLTKNDKNDIDEESGNEDVGTTVL